MTVYKFPEFLDIILHTQEMLISQVYTTFIANASKMRVLIGLVVSHAISQNGTNSVKQVTMQGGFFFF